VSWLQQFQRVTSGGRFIPVVDGLRCVAILSVILYHLEDYFTHKGTGWNPLDPIESGVHRLLHNGHVGVPLFFALSGFILALPFYESAFGKTASKPTNLRRYYLRRLTRLEPPYLINLAIATVLLCAVNGIAMAELLPHFAASAVYVHNQVYAAVSTINPVAWSLEIEVQFYLVAPLLTHWLISLRPIARRAIPLATIAALIVCKSIWGPWPTRLALSLPGTAEHFLAGMLLADVYVTSWKSTPLRSLRWDAVTAAVWPAIILSPQIPLLAHALPLLALTAYVAAFRGRITHDLLTRAPIVIIGGMCYTLYLYHFFIISFVGRFSLPRTAHLGYLPSLLIQCLVIVPVVIVAGAVLYRLFERPFMIWRPGQTAAVAPGDAASQPGGSVGNSKVSIAAATTGLDMEAV